MENALHRFVRLLRLRRVRISVPEALDAMRCAGEPGILPTGAPQAALRVALIKDRRDEEVFDEVFDRVLRAGQGRSHRGGPRPRARPRRPVRQRRARGLHALRGAERDPAAGAQPRQARRHPRLLRPRGPGPAVQPAPGGQQDRPGRDDRGDRLLEGQPGHPGATATGSRSRPTGSAARASPGRSPSTRAPRSTPTCRSPAGGAAGLAERRRGRARVRAAPRTTRRRYGVGSPACWPTCPRRSSATWRRCSRSSSGSSRSSERGASPRSTGPASPSGCSWRTRCAGSPTRCTAR